ncbi:MAG: hypothetical protein ABJF88_18615 [Rhodothermales bacterium]
MSTTTLSPPSSRLAQRIYQIGLATTWLVVAGAFLFWGLDYYVLPLAERPYADGHDLFKPTGLVGNRLAIAGTLMLTFGVASYSTRKRWERLQTWGKLRHWLSFHIFLCTLGPFLITLHTSFKVGGLVSIAFWSMVLVVASGLVGRYVYVRIPKTLNGRFRSMQEIEARQNELLAELAATGALAEDDLANLRTAQPATPRGLLHALALAVRFDWESRRETRRLDGLLRERGVEAETRHRLVDEAREHRKLAQQRVLLQPFGRLFRYWHTFHLPLAIVMFLILALHIGVAVAFGYAWTPAP